MDVIASVIVAGRARGLRFMRRLLRPVVLAPVVRQKLRRYVSEPKHEELLALTRLDIEAGHTRTKVIVKM